MAEPTDTPRWAETGVGVPDANIVEPNSGKKDTGWIDGEEPPSGYFNWLFWKLYKWVQWLQTHTFVGSANTPGGVGISATGKAAAGTGASGSPGATATGTNGTNGTATGVGGNGGIGATIVGGSGGSTSGAGTAGDGGHGLVVTGGDRGTTSGGVNGAAGHAIKATGGKAGSALNGTAGQGGAAASLAQDSTAPARGHLNMLAVTTTPSTPQDGDIWVENVSGTWAVKVRLNGATKTFTVT